jgi:Ca2+-binding EF-hand superfamily protein
VSTLTWEADVDVEELDDHADDYTAPPIHVHKAGTRAFADDFLGKTVDQILQSLDKDSDGYIDYAEFRLVSHIRI